MNDDKNIPPDASHGSAAFLCRRLYMRESAIRLLARPDLLAMVARPWVPGAIDVTVDELRACVGLVSVSPAMQIGPIGQVTREIWFELTLPSSALPVRTTLSFLSPQPRELYSKAVPFQSGFYKPPWDDTSVDCQLMAAPNYFDSDSFALARNLVLEVTALGANHDLLSAPHTVHRAHVVMLDLGDPKRVASRMAAEAEADKLAQLQALYLLDVLFATDLPFGRKLALLVRHLDLSLPADLPD